MFKRATLMAIALLMMCGTALIWSFSKLDSASYNREVAASEVIQEEIPPGKQYRNGVSKDLFLIHGKQRRHSRLVSPTSTLLFSFKGRNADIVEQMEDVRGTIQEDLFYDADGEAAQQIRLIEAKEASYRFDTGKFIGKEVAFDRFRAPGHELTTSFDDQTRSLTGHARGVEFTLGKGDLDFRADRMQATIYTQRGEL